MPHHVIQAEDARPISVVLSEALTRIEQRERVLQVVPAGNAFVVITEKRAGRPVKDTRVTAPKESR